MRTALFVICTFALSAPAHAFVYTPAGQTGRTNRRSSAMPNVAHSLPYWHSMRSAYEKGALGGPFSSRVACGTS